MGELNRDRIPMPLEYCEAHGLELIGNGAWRSAECEMHGGKETLRIGTKTGSWVCMSCGVKGGDMLGLHMARFDMPFLKAARELGCLDESKVTQRPDTKPRSMPASEALNSLRGAAYVLALVASAMARGPIDDADRQALLKATRQIDTVRGDMRT